MTFLEASSPAERAFDYGKEKKKVQKEEKGRELGGHRKD